MLRSIGQSACLGVKPTSGAQDRILVTVTVDLGRPRLKMCFLTSHSQSFLSTSPAGHTVIFYCFRIENPPNLEIQFSKFISSRNRVPKFLPPNTGFPSGLQIMLRPGVRRLLYSAVRHPPAAHDYIFITVKQLRVCCCGKPFLKRVRVHYFTVAAGPR
jgi:hypothetical protein